MRHLLVFTLFWCLSTLTLAQHSASRVQWQPNITEGGFSPDRRLEQTVKCDIIGRAARSALPMLSRQTGVALKVAPEDMPTVGERKVTILARGCTLRNIMIFMLEALQECHWDLDTSGLQAVYLLHRNSGVEGFPEKERKKQSELRERITRERQMKRIEEARRGLKLSKSQLAELERTDLFLARALRDPETRTLMEALLALPPDRIDGLRNARGRSVYMGEFSAPAQEIVRLAMEQARRAELLGSFARDTAPKIAPRPNFPLTISIDDNGDTRLYLRDHRTILIIPPKYPSSGSLNEELLCRTGTPADKALATIDAWEKKGEQAEIQERRARRKRMQLEPTSAKLHKSFFLGDTSRLSDLQERIARETGVSVISDYFTYEPLTISPQQARQKKPLWLFLYDVSKPDNYSSYDDSGPIEWRSAGDSLIFHQTGWYEMAARELPGSLITAWREKLRKQGHFSIEDVADVAKLLIQRANGYELPSDLSNAGIPGPEGARFVLLHVTLSPEQIAKAASSGGLSYAEMTPAQQEMAKAMLPEEVVRNTAVAPILRAKKSSCIMNHLPATFFEFSLSLPGRDHTERSASLHLPEASPARAAGAQ